ncbi:efflux RND transporter periplasmic adaptor subunit [Peptococcaceae bacterium 1198_IL3148]
MGRKKILLSLVLIALFLLMVGCGQQPQQAQVEEKIVPVEVMVAAKTDFNKQLEVTGETQAIKEVTVAPKNSLPTRVKAIHIQVGQSVNQGSLLMELDDTDANNDLRRAEAAIDLSQVQLESAQSNYDRYKQLYEASAISEADFEQVENALKTAQASHKQAQVNLDIAKNTLSELKIVAPISGKITALNTEVGEMVSAQSMVAEIANLNSLIVKLNISENVINNISVGQQVDVTIPSINQKVTGTITTIAPKVDTRTKSYPVEVKIPNQDGKVLAGMVAKLTLSTGKATNTIVVPVDAVLDDNGINKVFVVEKGVAKERVVTVGEKNADQIQILEGLEGKEQVIVTGNRLVGDGQKVEVVKSQSTDKPGVK